MSKYGLDKEYKTYSIFLALSPIEPELSIWGKKKNQCCKELGMIQDDHAKTNNSQSCNSLPCSEASLSESSECFLSYAIFVMRASAGTVVSKGWQSILRKVLSYPPASNIWSRIYVSIISVYRKFYMATFDPESSVLPIEATSQKKTCLLNLSLHPYAFPSCHFSFLTQPKT